MKRVLKNRSLQNQTNDTSQQKGLKSVSSAIAKIAEYAEDVAQTNAAHKNDTPLGRLEKAFEGMGKLDGAFVSCCATMFRQLAECGDLQWVSSGKIEKFDLDRFIVETLVECCQETLADICSASSSEFGFLGVFAAIQNDANFLCQRFSELTQDVLSADISAQNKFEMIRRQLLGDAWIIGILRDRASEARNYCELLMQRAEAQAKYTR